MPTCLRRSARTRAVAVMGATPGEMLDATIERAEAIRERSLGHLSELQLRTFSRHRNQQLLCTIELRLENLRAEREAQKRPAQVSRLA
jgi:hypothetical protein